MRASGPQFFLVTFRGSDEAFYGPKKTKDLEELGDFMDLETIKQKWCCFFFLKKISYQSSCHVRFFGVTLKIIAK